MTLSDKVAFWDQCSVQTMIRKVKILCSSKILQISTFEYMSNRRATLKTDAEKNFTLLSKLSIYLGNNLKSIWVTRPSFCQNDPPMDIFNADKSICKKQSWGQIGAGRKKGSSRSC